MNCDKPNHGRTVINNQFAFAMKKRGKEHKKREKRKKESMDEK